MAAGFTAGEFTHGGVGHGGIHVGHLAPEIAGGQAQADGAIGGFGEVIPALLAAAGAVELFQPLA